MKTTLNVTFRAVLVLSWCGLEALAGPAAQKFADPSPIEEADVSTDGEFDGGLPIDPVGDDSRELLGFGDGWAANGTNIYNTNFGNVGIGTNAPAAKLHVIGDVYSDGINGVYARNPSNVSAVGILGWLNNVARIRIGGDGAGATNGLDIQTTGNRSLMRLMHNGRVGIGTTSPGHVLDVAGRMRVRQATPATTGNTAGIWFYQQDLAADRSFVGMRNNSQVGLYGAAGAGWQFLMDVVNGNFRIGGSDAAIAPSGPKLSLIAGNQVGLGVLNNSGQTTATFRNAGSGQAGAFLGTLRCHNLIKDAGSFRIDHPLDPANKYLYHSFVESPDMMNIYNGNVVTDDKGYAVVTMPDWFEPLNREFRYQVTILDESDSDEFVQAKVVRKMSENQFTLRTSLPNVEVSWQVTGIRQDAWAEAHRIPVEEEKPRDERGKYTHPGLYGQPEVMGIDYLPSEVTEVAAEPMDDDADATVPK